MMLGFAVLVVGFLVTVVLPQITELLAEPERAAAASHARDHRALGASCASWWWALLLLGVGFVVGAPRAASAPSAAACAGTASSCACRCSAASCGSSRSRASRARSRRCSRAASRSCARSTSRGSSRTTRCIGAGGRSARARAITEGASIAGPLRASGQFPPLVIHMVEVGERSGELEAMLAKVADTYDEQVESRSRASRRSSSRS